MGALLKKLIPKNVAGVIGVIQALVPLVRELVIVIVRIFSILMPEKVNESLIVKVKSGLDTVEGLVEKFKNFFL